MDHFEDDESPRLAFKRTKKKAYEGVSDSDKAEKVMDLIDRMEAAAEADAEIVEENSKATTLRVPEFGPTTGPPLEARSG